MSHIASIGASLFSDFAIHVPVTDLDQAAILALDTGPEFQAKFATEVTTKTANGFVRIKGVREFPAMGTPPNIVNVPGYGSKTSQQIQGQSDAPSMEITVNYVPDDYKSGSLLGGIIGEQTPRLFRFALLNEEPKGTFPTQYASINSAVAGLGSVQNSQYYWIGKFEALQVNPQLTDATTATLSFTIQSKFWGAYTNDNA